MHVPTLTNTPAWRDEAKIAFIYTAGDLTVPVDYQKSMAELIEKEGKSVQTFELETGHCPNLTAVQA